MKLITYDVGGYDESKPNNNIISEVDIPEEPETTIEQKLKRIGLSMEELKNLLGINA